MENVLAVTREDRGEEKLDVIPISVRSLRQLGKQLNIFLIIQSRISATLNAVVISSRIMANPSDYVFTFEHILRSSPLFPISPIDRTASVKGPLFAGEPV